SDEDITVAVGPALCTLPSPSTTQRSFRVSVTLPAPVVHSAPASCCCRPVTALDTAWPVLLVTVGAPSQGVTEALPPVVMADGPAADGAGLGAAVYLAWWLRRWWIPGLRRWQNLWVAMQEPAVVMLDAPASAKHVTLAVVNRTLWAGR